MYIYSNYLKRNFPKVFYTQKQVIFDKTKSQIIDNTLINPTRF